MTSQVTIRASEELVQRVKLAANEAGRSMNEYVTFVLDAATNSDLAGSEAERVRQRLARAGLLAPTSSRRVTVPDQIVLDQARRRAARGRQLSQLVHDGR